MARVRPSVHILILSFSAMSLFFTPLTSQASGVDGEEPTWTVMAYMAADAEPTLPWEQDINEMEAADPPEWMDVVALVDPLGFGDSMLLEIEGDTSSAIVSDEVDDEGEVVPAYGEVDMASPDTLSDFIVFATQSYPADRFALVLWGHGGGWYGLCQDGSSVLSLPDLADAFEAVSEVTGRRMDIVVADSCSEGVLETMYELTVHADWYVGSEMNVPADGLRYDLVLGSLARDRTISPGDWGATICEIHRTTLYLESWSATMATFDLGAMAAFTDRLDELSHEIEGYGGLYRDALMDVLLQTASSDFVEWYIDIGDALRRFAAADLPLEVGYLAVQALMAYDDLVYRFEAYADPLGDDYDSVHNCTGAAVYVPSDDPMDEPYWSVSFSDLGWADATALIRKDEPSTTNAPGPEVTCRDTDGDGEEDEATLHWDADCDRCEAWVFVQTEAGMQLLGRLEAEGSDLTVSGFGGELLVSASAWSLGSAVSHHTPEILLSRTLDIRVSVSSGDGPVTDGVEVRVHTRDGPMTLSPSDGLFVGTVTVPSDIDFGDLLTVDVIGMDGEVLAWNRTYVQGTEVVLEIRLVKDIDDPVGTQFLIPATVLGVCAIVAAFYVSDRMRRRGDEP